MFKIYFSLFSNQTTFQQTLLLSKLMSEIYGFFKIKMYKQFNKNAILFLTKTEMSVLGSTCCSTN